MSICFLVAFPLGASMIVAGGFSVNACTNPSINVTTTVVEATDSFAVADIVAKNVSEDVLSIESETQTEMVHIPGVDFSNILQTAFFVQKCFSKLFSIYSLAL